MSERVFVAVVQDRHADPGVVVFDDMNDAIRWVRSEFAATVAHPEYIRELPVAETFGVIHLVYMDEADEAWVAESTLNRRNANPESAVS